MAHGYLGDGYGIHGDFDPDRGDDRDRERAWRGEADWRERRGGDDWRDRQHDRDRGMMFGGRERERSDEGRWSDRSWNREGYRREHAYGSEERRSVTANPDDHYRSWRDRHMSELDRDYADYCREREHQFHQDFDQWRSQRHASYQPLRTGMTQSGISHDPSGEVQVTTEGTADQSGTDPMGDATLGTNSENNTGRGRR